VIPVSLSYKNDKGKGKSKKLGIVIPVSLFVVSKKISSDQMQVILAEAEDLALSSQKIHLNKSSVAEALRMVSGVVNVALVEAVSFTATYYGQVCLDNSHVAIMVKAKRDDDTSIWVDIKGANQAWTDGLMKELIASLKR